MTETQAEALVGGIVLAIAGAFLFYLMQFTGGTTAAGHYTLTASFRSIEGVRVGTDVRLAGVKVGSVSGVSLDKKTFRADTKMSIEGDIEIPEDSAVIIASEGLLGGNFVEIQPGGSPFNLDQGAEIEDTQGAVSLITLLTKFVAGGE
ncbi:MAG: outer membrane lipid asymmetry maintenance protein MlaD [Halocynthiibacter sp.]